jgi:hypothetical protein
LPHAACVGGLLKGVYMDCEFVFETTTGAGSEIVTVCVDYEIDEDGIYNDNIMRVKFEGVDVLGLLTDEQFNELEIEASMKLREYIAKLAEPSDFGLL